MILFITSKYDPHVDYLVELLEDDFFRLNVDDLLSFHQLDYRVTNEDIISKIVNKKNTSFDMSKITSVYYRRPTMPSIIDNITNENTKQLIKSETKEFLRQYYYSFSHLKWLCSPWVTDFARGRINQLTKATKLGIKIPKTFVTNNKKDFLDFFYECNQKVIIKTINPRSFIYNGSEKEYFYTEVIDNDNIENINFNLLKNSPTLFQEFIDSEYELRITSVDNKHFAVKITSNITDWRKRKAIVAYDKYELPEMISIYLSKYLKSFNLNFGCFDFIKGKDGEYYFLEVNPNGQWLWLEAETGVPIGNAIIDYLSE